MDGTPMTTSTRKGWQSHGSHAHVQTAMLVIAVVDLNRIREERKKTNGKTCRLKTRPTPSSAQY